MASSPPPAEKGGKKHKAPPTTMTQTENFIMCLLPISQALGWAGLCLALSMDTPILVPQACVGGFFALWAGYNRLFIDRFKKLEMVRGRFWCGDCALCRQKLTLKQGVVTFPLSPLSLLLSNFTPMGGSILGCVASFLVFWNYAVPAKYVFKWGLTELASRRNKTVTWAKVMKLNMVRAGRDGPLLSLKPKISRR